jgi:hypothetical protein
LARSVIVFSFKVFLELRKRTQSGKLEFADPTLGDLVDRHGVDEVQLFPAVPFPGDEIGLLEDRQMLRDCLAGHLQPLAQFTKRLAISAVQPIQQPPTASIGQSAKHNVLFHASNMEPFGYLTIWNRLVACQAKSWRPCAGDRRRAFMNRAAPSRHGASFSIPSSASA